VTKEIVTIERNKSFISAFGFSVVFALLLLSKIAWGIWDVGCPTYTLNMINQIRSGKFPASFPAAPTIEANYHQGHLLISALIGNLLGVDSLTSLRIFIIVFSTFGFYILANMAARILGTFIGPTVAFFCFTVTSFPNEQTWPLNSNTVGAYEYLSLFEYLVSPSWPFALFLSIFILTKIKNDNSANNYVIPLLFILPFLNATFFSVLFCSYVFYLVLQLSYELRMGERPKYLILYFFFAAITYFLKDFTVSAFRVGTNYENPPVVLRIGQENWIDFIMFYFQIQTPLFLIGIFLSARLLYLGKYQFFALFNLISICFPVLFEIQGVDNWDNAHKFVILTSFSTLLVILKFFEQVTFKRHTVLVTFLIVSMAMSFPSQFNNLNTRYSTSLYQSLKIEKPAKLSEFLNQEKNPVMVWLYSESMLDICGSFNRILNETNVAAAGFYWSNFLLAPELESSISKDSRFAKEYPKETLLRNREFRHLVVVPEELVSQFQKEPQFSEGKFVPFKKVDTYLLFTFK
jgi:hypothetical protein